MKIVSLRSCQLDPLWIDKILSLKEQEWSHGMTSQYAFFEKYYFHPHVHFLMQDESELIAYGMTKHRPDGVEILDSIIVDQHYRHQGFGKQLIHFILDYHKRCNGKSKCVLICRKHHIGFYQTFGFTPQPHITFSDKPLRQDQAILTNFDSPQRIYSYNQDYGNQMRCPGLL